MRHYKTTQEGPGPEGSSRLRHVYVVDSDTSSRENLVSLCRKAGYAAQGFTSGNEVVQSHALLQRPCCVLSELRFESGMSGMELLACLSTSSDPRTLLFLSDSADVTTAVAAMKAGAYSVIEKPFPAERLLHEISGAVAADEVIHQRALRFRMLKEAHDALTEREAYILGQLLIGRPNKSIAKSLDVSVRSIENFRARIYSKYDVETPAELAVKATELKIFQQGAHSLSHPAFAARDLV